MFAKVSASIAQSLTNSGKIDQENQAICQYGVKQIFTIALNIMTTISIGILFHMVWESIFFTVAYIPLRSYAGGFHAKTALRCYLYSILMIVAVLVALRYTPNHMLYYVAAFLASSAILWTLAPIEDRNKPLDALEKKVYRKRTVLVWGIESLLIVFLYFLQWRQSWHCIVLSMLTLSLLLIAGKIKNTWIHKKTRESNIV